MARRVQEKTIIAALKKAVKEHGSIRKYCRHANLNLASVSTAIRGLSRPTPTIAEALGYRRVVLYEKIEK